MRPWRTRLLWCSWASLVVLLGAAHMIGQRSLWTAMLVFGPVSWWTIVALLISAGAYKRDRRLACLSFVTAIIIAGPTWEYRTHHPTIPSNAKQCLRVLTCNRGQHNGHTITQFITQQRPDILAIQESNDPNAYVPTAPEYAVYPYSSRISELQLLSRYPITNARPCFLSGVLKSGRTQTWTKVARFEVQTPEGSVVVYSVHLLSPRFEVRSFIHARIADRTQRVRVEQFEDEQTALLEATMKQVESETLPTIVCGDFNVAPLGPLYRRMTQHFRDSQLYGGVGYGFTFPGDVTLPFTGGQWIRIDYVLANRSWDILRCEVEEQTGSQHSAVVSTLRFK